LTSKKLLDIESFAYKKTSKTRLLPIIVSVSYIYVSQNSVATQLRCDRIFNKHIIAICSQNLPLKEFWKSVYLAKIWTMTSGKFFLRHSVEYRH